MLFSLTVWTQCNFGGQHAGVLSGKQNIGGGVWGITETRLVMISVEDILKITLLDSTYDAVNKSDADSGRGTQ